MRALLGVSYLYSFRTWNGTVSHSGSTVGQKESLSLTKSLELLALPALPAWLVVSMIPQARGFRRERGKSSLPGWSHRDDDFGQWSGSELGRIPLLNDAAWKAAEVMNWRTVRRCDVCFQQSLRRLCARKVGQA